MLVTEVRRENHKHEYGISCTRIYPNPEVSVPFGSTWCEVEGGGSTLPHSHQEGESFFIYKGHGEMDVAGACKKVGPGDVVHIPAHSLHQLRNLSVTDRIEFISVYWDTEHEFPLTPPTLIAIAPPTPNGDLHLGHLAGPYIASDIFARSLKIRNIPVHLMTGSDDHQSYVPLKAQKLNKSGVETAELYTKSIQETFKKASIGIDTYLRPLTDKAYQNYIRKLFSDLVERSVIKEKENNIYYCNECEIYLYEAYLSGSCPHCNSKTNAFGCEACGHYNIGSDLRNPACNQCQGTPVMKSLKQYVMPLKDHEKEIRSWQTKTTLSDRLRSYANQVIEKGLPEIPVSLPGKWGITINPSDKESLVLYEWFEMAGGYLYTLEKLQNEAPPFSENKRFELFFGFDNAFFYLNLIPAVLMAAESKTLPTGLYTNEFYLLENSKFSTSRNHAVWANDTLKFLPPDALRFHLAHHRPECSQTNFSLEELLNTFKHLEQICDQTLLKIGTLPLKSELHLNITNYPAHLDFEKQMDSILIDFAKAYDPRNFSTRAQTRAFIAGMEVLTTFIHTENFYSESAAIRTESAVPLILSALTALFQNVYPIMPGYARQVLTALGVNTLRLYPKFKRDYRLVHHIALPNNYFNEARTQLNQFIHSSRNPHAN